MIINVNLVLMGVSTKSLYKLHRNAPQLEMQRIYSHLYGNMNNRNAETLALRNYAFLLAMIVRFQKGVTEANVLL